MLVAGSAANGMIRIVTSSKLRLKAAPPQMHSGTLHVTERLAEGNVKLMKEKQQEGGEKEKEYRTALGHSELSV